MQVLPRFLISLIAMMPITSFAAYQLELNKPLPELSVSDSHGGLVKDGSAWKSSSMLGALHLLVYVDPDDSDLNDELTNRLQAEKFDEDKFRSVAIINLAATWKPNPIIMSVLRGKQEKFPRTTYVFDKDRYVAQNWNLVAEGYHVLLIDRDETVIYQKSGKLEKNEIEKFVQLIKLKLKDGDRPTLAKPEPTTEEAQKTKKSL